MKKSTLSFVIVTAIASIATNVSAVTAPATYDQAFTQHQADIVDNLTTEVANQSAGYAQYNNNVLAATQAASTATAAANAAMQTVTGKADQAYVDQQDSVILNQAKANTTQQVTDFANILGQHIDDEETRAIAAENALDSRVTSVNSFAGAINATVQQQAIDNIQRDKTITGNAQAVAAEAATRGAQVNKLDNDITAETSRATTEEKRLDSVKVDNSTFQQRAADVDQRIAQHKADQDKVNKAVAGELSNHEDRIQTLEADKGYGNKFAALKKTVEDNRKIAGAGVSGAMAQANIPQVIQGQTFAVGAAVGGYDSQNALAVGFSARASESVVVKASVSTDTADNFGYGAGVSVGW